MDRRYKLIIKTFLTIMFVLVVLHKTDMHALICTIAGYSPGYFILAFGVNILAGWVGSCSLYAVYQKQSVSCIFKVTLKSSFYAMFLPGQLLGETTKIFMLSKDGSSLLERTAAVFVDKFLNLFALAFVGSCGALLSSNLHDPGITACLGSGFMISFLIMIFLNNRQISAFFVKFAKKKIHFMKNSTLKKKAQDGLDICRMYAVRKRQLAYSAMWGILYQILIALIYYILGNGIQISVNYLDYCWVNAILTILLLLPVSISGIGIREVSLSALLGLLGVEPEQAVAVSLLLLLIQILRAVLGGILIFTEKEKT